MRFSLRRTICFLVLCFFAFSGGAADAENTAAITVGTQVVNTVDPLIFGDNLSWRGDGYGVWDEANQCLDASLVEAIRDSGITHLRYPGGIEGDYFHWNEAIGKTRIPQIDPFSMDWPTSALKAGETYAPDFGPDEFQQLLEATGLRATILLNAGNGTPGEAADWVAYCLERGMDVASFCLGNEVHFGYEKVSGITIGKTETQYVAFYREMMELLKAKIGEDAARALEIGVIGLPPSHPLCARKLWDRQVLTALADEIDFIDVHLGYSPYTDDLATSEEVARCFMASAQWIRGMLDDVKAEIADYGGENAEDIGIQISEYGPMTNDFKYKTLAGALFQADFFNMVLREPQVVSANHLPMLNHYAAATVIGTAAEPAVVGGAGRVFWKNAVSYVFDLYTQRIGDQVLDVSVSAGRFSSDPVGLVPAVEDVPLADAGAYLSADGETLTLLVLNRDTANGTEMEIRLPYASVTVSGVRRLWSEDPMAYNSWSRTSVTLETLPRDSVTVSGGNLSLTMEPLSLYELTVTRTP